MVSLFGNMVQSRRVDLEYVTVPLTHQDLVNLFADSYTY